MAELTFKYAVMNGSKTLQLLATAHSYESQNKTVILVKPETDTRSRSGIIETRAGLSRMADIIVTDETDVFYEITKRYHEEIYAVLVDEANFLDANHIEALTKTVDYLGISVILYGLRTDFRGELFPASKRAMELADHIEEIPTVCHEEDCGKKAVINMRMINGTATLDGDQVVVGDIASDADDIEYKPVCRTCYGKYLRRR